MLPQGMALDRVPLHSCAELRRVDQDINPGADSNKRLPPSGFEKVERCASVSLRRLPADRLVVGTGIEPATSRLTIWCSYL